MVYLEESELEELSEACGGDGKVSEYVRRQLFPNCGSVVASPDLEVAGSNPAATLPKQNLPKKPKRIVDENSKCVHGVIVGRICFGSGCNGYAKER